MPRDIEIAWLILPVHWVMGSVKRVLKMFVGIAWGRVANVPPSAVKVLGGIVSFLWGVGDAEKY